jgi:hypothetical protein
LNERGHSRDNSSLGCGPLTYNTTRFVHLYVFGNRKATFLEVFAKMRLVSDGGRCSCIVDVEAPEGADDGRLGSKRTCSVLHFLTSRFCRTKDGGEVDELEGERSCM